MLYQLSYTPRAGERNYREEEIFQQAKRPSQFISARLCPKPPDQAEPPWSKHLNRGNRQVAQEQTARIDCIQNRGLSVSLYVVHDDNDMLLA